LKYSSTSALSGFIYNVVASTVTITNVSNLAVLSATSTGSASGFIWTSVSSSITIVNYTGPSTLTVTGVTGVISGFAYNITGSTAFTILQTYSTALLPISLPTIAFTGSSSSSYVSGLIGIVYTGSTIDLENWSYTVTTLSTVSTSSLIGGLFYSI
jgi:hypothetical protein